MRFIFKSILVKILGWQVKRLRVKNDFKIVGVVGSIGKTSTKLAIAKVLESAKKVRYQEGNYNDIVSVPLVFFGRQMPSLFNVFSWLRIIFLNEIQIFSKFPYEIAVVELGTDKPGDISAFRKYLHLDIAVITAVTPEHMEFFETLERVAEEEWSVRFFSDLVFVNRDLCELLPKDLNHNQVMFYGRDIDSRYQYEVVSGVQLYAISIAIILAKKFGLEEEKIKKSIGKIKSFAGRMQKLEGINSSVIIDDTYNASPEAMKIALDTLYAHEASQRIAILGMMNELGAVSAVEHKKVGEYCNPEKLDLVVTVGDQANRFLAPAAKEKGCQIYEAKDAKDAGQFLKDKIKEGAIILAKGSQNGVFTEEALKTLLKNSADVSKLVRQGPDWTQRKLDFFGK